MTRAVYTGSGLPGPGQDIWTEQAKDHGRDIFLTDSARVLVEDDDDTAPAKSWEPITIPAGPWKLDDTHIRCHIDPMGRDTTENRGAQLAEDSTHLISIDPGAPVDTDNRIDADGIIWILLASRLYSDAEIMRFEAKEASG